MADPAWLRGRPGGVELAIHVRPGAKRSGMAGVHGTALCVRVAARPVEGAANRELIRVLADALGVSQRTIALRAGTHGRAKRVEVAGLTPADVADRLAPYLRIDTGIGRD